MPLNKRTYRLLDGILSYLKGSMDDLVSAWNEEHPEAELPMIEETDLGFRDVVAGLRSYPALCIAELGRDASRAYFTDYELNVCLALRNDDIVALQETGYCLMDCLEDAIRNDSTLGGNVVDSLSVTPEVGVVSNVFICAVRLKVEVDLGSFGGMD